MFSEKFISDQVTTTLVLQFLTKVKNGAGNWNPEKRIPENMCSTSKDQYFMQRVPFPTKIVFQNSMPDFQRLCTLYHCKTCNTKPFSDDEDIQEEDNVIDDTEYQVEKPDVETDLSYEDLDN